MHLDINEIPELYKRYRWADRHALWGYRADEFPHFNWIASLEQRFANVLTDSTAAATIPIYLIREMIHWGGSQNGVLEKFELQLGTYNLATAFERIVQALDDPAQAIGAALDIPGMGLSYASKLLRFMRPQTYGALDSQIRRFLQAPPQEQSRLRNIHDSSKPSMVRGYVDFTMLLADIKTELDRAGMTRPTAASEGLPWRAADIEMALFQKSLERND